ncbi:hypothetical protein IRZ71_10740 [Flavobacterium sp. ANB]|uniref:hypothetical protein n=1 Tax=unclassified Flavobacterium TaxID=196869 RepID=UPI0012B9E72A|nr:MULTISPECIES: hypothetical protein [unclassified Flavobacterium]MBF4516826.1 hypothetical protein [Flavobacterium sp. ANB]MTD69278.1 hypothetical protein [Flavobacterium sp. LC2016-13]
MKVILNGNEMRLIIISLSLILFSCKDFKTQESNDLPKNVIAKNTKLTCEDIAYQIVKSSNLELRGQKDFLTQIDRIEGDNITIHVYIENNISEDPKTKQIVESTIAWLSLNVNDNKLFNTTADPDNPIELNFDKKILSENDVFSLCQIVKKEKKEVVSNQAIKYSILPIDFDEYYKACVNPYDSIQCNKNYPKYFYKENDAIAKFFGNNFHPSDYMYLPKLNDYQPIILCNTDSDTESYDLIVLNNDKIISSLEIGIMDGGSITQFVISKDYKINLYKRKNTTEKNVFFKSYNIDKNGSIVEIK